MATPTTSLPSPPFITVPGLPNFRDAGGYPVATSNTTSSQKIVRTGILFRASEPSQVTATGVSIMTEQLGIQKVYDLRSQTEIDKDTHRAVREWEGSERVFAPVFTTEDYSPEAVAKRFSAFASESDEGFVKVYTRILNAGSSPTGPFAPILRQLVASPSTPILIHCTAGKDRTGVIIALILSLCGVPDAAVAHEYSLTDLGLQARKAEFVEHLVSVEPLKGNRAAAERMVSSRWESMMGTLRMIRETWGGVEEYVKKECGLSAEEVEAIRKNLVVEGEPLDWEALRKSML